MTPEPRVVVTWCVADSAGVECGTVRAGSRDEALGKAQIKFGLSRYPFTVEVTT